MTRKDQLCRDLEAENSSVREQQGQRRERFWPILEGQCGKSFESEG